MKLVLSKENSHLEKLVKYVAELNSILCCNENKKSIQFSWSPALNYNPGNINDEINDITYASISVNMYVDVFDRKTIGKYRLLTESLIFGPVNLIINGHFLNSLIFNCNEALSLSEIEKNKIFILEQLESFILTNNLK